MKPKMFETVAGYSAFLGGITAFLYAVAFIIISKDNPQMGALLSALFLFLTGVFAVKALVGLYFRLREVNEGFALTALLTGLFGAFGMMIHGGYDLANVINAPVANKPALANLPSQIDPRGLLSFGAFGIALLDFSWLMAYSKRFPKSLAYLGFLSGVLSIVLYLGRLTVLSPASPVILFPAVLNGFIVGPLWYTWLGMIFLRGKEA